MKQLENIGISNAVTDADSVVHSTLMGRSSFGRVADLLCIWSEKEHGFQVDSVSGLRMLIQALLEFVIRGGEEGAPLIEFAAPASRVILAVRSVCPFPVGDGEAEKVFTQHWLNSPESAILKRVLNPEDRIEVRYQPKTRLVEWRVIRALDPDEVQDLSVSFFVMLDGRDTVVSDHAGYQDLGDLPYESWLEDSYRGAGAKTVRSGEVKLENGESLEEVELARFTVDREISEADQIFSSDSSESGEEDIHESDTLKRITEEVGRPDGARVAEIDLIIEEMKAEERRYRREAWITKSKINFLESLSNQKERLTQRLQKRVKELQEEIEALQKNERAQRENNPFKDKALQMFEALSKAKRENQILERDLADLRRRQALAPDQEGFGDSERQAAARNLEETLKKLDRTQRALDAEKTKSAQLSARAISAEKELAKADPIIKDLEMKIETIMKTSNQAKKEVENIKQRLVQAEGEKNRIQNELVKAQAQISTLMKRHAS